MRPFLAKLSVIYMLMLALFSISIILVHFIPRSSIESNVLMSAHALQNEDVYERKWFKGQLFKLDNYTDALMLNIAITADNRHPVRSAMLNKYYVSDQWRAKADDLLATTQQNFDNLQSVIYGRYWHGYQVILRPLLCHFSHQQIRTVNCLLLWSLAITALALVWIRVGKAPSLLFLVALLRVNFPLVPFSMQYSTCFYLMLISVVLLMLFPSLTRGRSCLYLSFFVIGGFTVFFDFLTTPLITLGVPLILVFLSNPIPHRSQQVLYTTFFWFLGYGSLWVSKWILGYFLTGFNLLTDAITTAQIRVSSTSEGTSLDWAFVWNNKVSMPEPLIWIVVPLLFIIFCYWAKRHCRSELLRSNRWLLVVASLVPIWFAVLWNHTIVHLFFTQRTLIVPLYALLLWTYFICCIPKTDRPL